MMRGHGLLYVMCIAACGGGPMMTTGGDDTVSAVTAVALTQSVGGGMFVDPDAFPTIPVHVQVTGTAVHVSVAIDGTATDAAADATGLYTAQVPVGALADGSHALVADADGVQANAVLGVGRDDLQWTDFSVEQNAETPRLQRIADHLYLTWTDISSGTRVAWLQDIDGAGQKLAAKVALVGGAGQEDVLYARTAFGHSSIGVLFQQRGGPYKNFFTIVGTDGRPQLAPIALDPIDRYGSWGGDVVFDGTGGYDIGWRTNDGIGHSDVRWLHVDEGAQAIGQPLVVAAPGMDDPHGGFDPIYDLQLHHAGALGLVAFKRYEYDTTLQLEVARCQIAVIAPGAIAKTELGGIGHGQYWDDDCRILDDGKSAVAMWASKDLASSADNPPDQFFAARIVGDALATGRGDGHVVMTAPESRGEPWIVATSANPVMAWTDARSYAASTANGQVQLYVATLSSDLTAGTNTLFAKTHFIEGTGMIHGAAAGPNAILTWVDERHGGNVLMPHPEIYLETVWQ